MPWPWSALMSCPLHCSSVQLLWGSELCTNTRAPNKDVTAWIKVLNNTGKSLFSPLGSFACLACPHWSLRVSWRAIRARQTLSSYHTRDVTWGQTQSLWIEKLLRLSSLICYVLSRDAFECDSFAFEMHPGADGEEMIICLFSSRSEPLLASIVKSQCCVSHHSRTPVGTKYENIFMHDVCWKQIQSLRVKLFSANGILHW